MHLAPVVMAAVRTWKESVKHNLNIIGALCLVSIAYWRRGTLVRQYSHRLTVWCASTIFEPIAYKLSFRRKDNGHIKNKQTSIATVRNHILTVACFPTDSQNFLFFFIYLTWGKGSGVWCGSGMSEYTPSPTLFVFKCLMPTYPAIYFPPPLFFMG